MKCVGPQLKKGETRIFKTGGHFLEAAVKQSLEFVHLGFLLPLMQSTITPCSLLLSGVPLLRRVPLRLHHITDRFPSLLRVTFGYKKYERATFMALLIITAMKTHYNKLIRL